MEIFAWCLMTNHVHLVFRSAGKIKPEIILQGIKSFSSRKMVEAIIENPQESRRDWQLDIFAKAAKETSNVKNYQLWRHDNKPIELWSNKVISEKIRYIHQNPVEEGLVFYPEDYYVQQCIRLCRKKKVCLMILLLWIFKTKPRVRTRPAAAARVLTRG